MIPKKVGDNLFVVYEDGRIYILQQGEHTKEFIDIDILPEDVEELCKALKNIKEQIFWARIHILINEVKSVENEKNK